MLNTTHKKVMLVVLDGWGIGPHNTNSNPLQSAKLPNISWFKANFPSGSLQASGLLVGLPWKEEGNSEIGHLTIGSGRTAFQMAVKIQLAIENGEFFKNPALLGAIESAKKPGSSLAIAGLIGSGITHSSFAHLEALIRMAKNSGIEKVKLHLFLDGRDSPPKSALDFIERLPQNMIGSVSGRFYGMDRDNHAERTTAAFKAMTGAINPSIVPPREYISKSYEANLTDEFIRPAFFDNDLAVKPGDSLILFNFRTDRMKQITKMFIDKMPATNLASFTKYDNSFPIPFAFPFEHVPNSLGEIISSAGIPQLRIAESEKQAHVTYFFSGERETPFEKEFRIILPSRNVTDHSKFPEMQSAEIADRVVDSISEGFYGFILVNLANADMVAHTGKYEATVKAAESIDAALGRMGKSALEHDWTMIVTADHGNAECVIDSLTGEPDTKHNPNPVPVWIIDRRLARPHSPMEIAENEKSISGTLCDIAPTILDIMRMPKPPEMTGQSVLPFL